jgi:hypothetical protein
MYSIDCIEHTAFQKLSQLQIVDNVAGDKDLDNKVNITGN